jgi:hypothetical protein
MAQKGWALGILITVLIVKGSAGGRPNLLALERVMRLGRGERGTTLRWLDPQPLGLGASEPQPCRLPWTVDVDAQETTRWYSAFS